MVFPREERSILNSQNYLLLTPACKGIIPELSCCPPFGSELKLDFCREVCSAFPHSLHFSSPASHLELLVACLCYVKIKSVGSL